MERLPYIDEHARSIGAAFPGAPGRVYRALVIASGAYRIVVGRLLRKVEARACSV